MRKILSLLLIITCSDAYAEVGRVTGLPIPRFVSLKSKITNIRSGPSNQHSVKWVYHKKGYPVKVVAEFERWRKIKDLDGEEGWAHESILSGNRYVIITNGTIKDAELGKSLSQEILLMRKPAVNSQPIARIQLGAVCSLKSCQADWCEIICESHKGWVPGSDIWGITSADSNMKFK